MDNAAFVDGDAPEQELRRILVEEISKTLLEDGFCAVNFTNRLHDFNGNTVGFWKVED